MTESFETTFGPFATASKGRVSITLRREMPQIRTAIKAAQLEKFDAFLDIGANAGVYTAVIGQFTDIRTVHAFEADPDTYHLLSANIELQNLQAVAHNVALSDSSRRADFHRFGNLSGANGLAETSARSDGEVISVDCAPLDEIVSSVGERILIKLDIEGHELRALLGARQLMTKNQCLLQVECLSAPAEEEIATLLKSYGYEYIMSIHNDYYFISRDMERLSGQLREFCHIAYKYIMDDYLKMVKYASQLSAQKVSFLDNHPEYASDFATVRYPNPTTTIEFN